MLFFTQDWLELACHSVFVTIRSLVRNPTSPLGDRWSSDVSLPSVKTSNTTPSSPARGRGLPLPLPPPLGLGGGAARRSSVQDGPRWLQECLREPKISSKMAQDSPRWLKIASDTHPRGLKTAPRRFQVPSAPSKDPPKRPKSFKSRWKINVVCLLAFSPPMGS